MKELKQYLIINSLFSSICGLLILLISSNLSELFNINNKYVFPIIGSNLLVFSAFVWFVSQKQVTNKTLVNIISLLDLLWVIGSFTIIGFRLFNISSIGYLLMSIIAIWIAFLAFKQFTNNK